jgi:hypothetical protein
VVTLQQAVCVPSTAAKGVLNLGRLC